jgi:LacI family transcriptional regulator
MTQRQPRLPARIRDVAALAGVSPATVSRYLNGTMKLPAETGARISAAALELRYRPNPVARSLGRGVTDVIGLALPDIANPFFGQLAAALEEAALPVGRTVSLSSTRNLLDRELMTIERLERGHYDALILATNRPDDGRLAEAIRRNAARIVLLDEDIPGVNVPKVFSDNRTGGLLAGRLLVEAGHRRIAYIGGPRGLMSADDRGAGLAEAAGHCDLVSIACEDYTADCGQRATAQLIASHPDVTAVFFGSDALLLGGLVALRTAGRQVGRDCSVVSFDDVGPLEFFAPPITAIRHRIADLARHSIAAAIRATEGGGAEAEYATVVVPVDAIVRGSVTAPPRITFTLGAIA